MYFKKNVKKDSSLKFYMLQKILIFLHSEGQSLNTAHNLFNYSCAHNKRILRALLIENEQ